MVAGINWRFVDDRGRLHYARPVEIPARALPPGGCVAEHRDDRSYRCELCNAEWTIGDGGPVCAMTYADALAATIKGTD